LVIATAAMMALGAVPAHADSSEPPDVPKTYTDGAGVVHYAFDPDWLPGADVVVSRGAVSKSAGCVIAASGSGAVEGEGTVTVGRELTFDPATCTVQMAVASYPADETPAVVLERFGPTGDLEHAEESSGEGVGARATTWNGFINVFYNDPVSIRVNMTGASHTWSSAGAVSHYNTWDWFSASGWYRDAYSTGNTSTATNTKATFRNTLFCNPVANTYTYHNRTEFRGYTNGTWDWGWNTTKSGDCASLLSAGYYVQTP